MEPRTACGLPSSCQAANVLRNHVKRRTGVTAPASSLCSTNNCNSISGVKRANASARPRLGRFSSSRPGSAWEGGILHLGNTNRMSAVRITPTNNPAMNPVIIGCLSSKSFTRIGRLCRIFIGSPFGICFVCFKHTF